MLTYEDYMSGKLGTCVFCGEEDEGMFNLQIWRWGGNDYEIDGCLCQPCFAKIGKEVLSQAACVRAAHTWRYPGEKE